MTRCAVHARGTPLADESKGNRMHIVRMLRSDGSGYVPRRYDRENDSFVDPPPDEEE